MPEIGTKPGDSPADSRCDSSQSLSFQPRNIFRNQYYAKINCRRSLERSPSSPLEMSRSDLSKAWGLGVLSDDGAVDEPGRDRPGACVAGCRGGTDYSARGRPTASGNIAAGIPAAEGLSDRRSGGTAVEEARQAEQSSLIRRSYGARHWRWSRLTTWILVRRLLQRSWQSGMVCISALRRCGAGCWWTGFGRTVGSG